MAAGNQQKHLEFTFSIKALPFHSRTSIRAHKHILLYLKWLNCWKLREETFFNETAFLFWSHAQWELGSSNCCIFEIKHASGLENCTKIYFLFIFNLNLAFFCNLMTTLWKPSINEPQTLEVSRHENWADYSLAPGYLQFMVLWGALIYHWLLNMFL